MTIAEAYSEESKEICFLEVNLNFVAIQFPPRSADSLKQQLACIFVLKHTVDYDRSFF